MKISLFLVLLFSSLACSAQDTEVLLPPPDWVYAVTSTDLEKSYVKSEYVTKDYSEIKVWIKTKFPSRTYNKRVYKNGEIKQLWIVNCNTKQIQILQSIMYDFKGNVVYRQKLEEYELEWTDVVPESIGEATQQKICQLFE